MRVSRHILELVRRYASPSLIQGRSANDIKNDCFIIGAEDGTVWRYDLESGKVDKLLVRCALPVRDLAISSDGQWVAVASE